MCGLAAAHGKLAVIALALEERDTSSEPDAELARAIATLRQVGAEGAGSREASQAWLAIRRDGGAEDVSALLDAFSGATPLAANWLRSAVDAICERDPRAFDNYLVPLAIIALRQGVGRLIRCKTDVGVAVILDKRIAEKGYGKKFLKSLPPMLTTRRVENISRFLEEAAYARAS